MKVFIMLYLASISVCVYGNSSYVSKISDIDYGSEGQHHLLLLEDGHVLKIKDVQGFNLSSLAEYQKEDVVYEFKFDKDRFVTSISPVGETKKVSYHQLDRFQEYVPTTVKDLSTLKSYFREAPYNPKDSQCFNRAMVWSYGWWRTHSLKSMKLFIFFTRSYIRRYNFEWWFHVAPYAHVLVDNKVVERVLDIKYASGPLPFKQWTDLFMKNDAICPVITKYSEYADNPYNGDCYIYRSNMYFYQPADLQMNEAWGYDKKSFNMGEVRGAYKEAFDIDLN